MSIITIKDVSKQINKTTTFGPIDLDLSLKQIVTVVGPKKSGKTMLLNLVSGIETCFNGDIFIDNHLISNHTKSIISYCPSKTMYDVNLKIIDVLKLNKAIYKDFNYEKAVGFFAENSINIKKKIGNFKIFEQYIIQLIIVLSRETKIYLIDDLFTKIKHDKLTFFIELIKKYSTSSLVILTSQSYKFCEDFSNLFLFLKEGKITSLVTNKEIKEKKSIYEYSWEVFSNV